jgi:single-stranded DNA-specific DHH superfamily exonuclease
MLTEKEIKQIKEELDNCTRPLFLFHDDADGLCSFLLFYRYKQEGKGIVVKTAPKLGEIFLRKVEEYQPDKVFVLDIPIRAQEFIDKCKVPIVWIDHHEPVQVERVRYFNGKRHDPNEYVPVSYYNYNVTGNDEWIAMVGCLGDAYIPPFTARFKKNHPELMPKKANDMKRILYSTKIGLLTKVFNFSLKGKSSDVTRNVKILTRIEGPSEILEQTSSRGKLLWKHFEKINEKYDKLLKRLLSKKSKSKVLIFIYEENNMALSATLCNEAIYRMPDKFIIVGRYRNGEYKMSLRYNLKPLPEILERALHGLDGYGGGHPYACGACVKDYDFPQFVQNIKEEIE